MQLSEMINSIRSGTAGRDRIIAQLYDDQHLQNTIKKILRVGNGSEEDFRSILSFTLVQFLKTVMKNKELTINGSLNNYLAGIARNLWVQELRKRNKLPRELPEDFNLKDETPSVDLRLIEEERSENLDKVLSKLGKNCKEVLMLWASNFKMAEIATQLNYKSEGMVRKKKYNCMKELSNYLEEHPQLKNLLSL